MKKFDNIEKDAAFLRANIETNEERIRLPESLSEQNIADLVSGKKQRRNKKAIIRRFVGLAAAACLAVGIFAALDYGVYAPKQLPVTEANGLAYAQSYDDIVSIVKDYAKFRQAENAKNSMRLGGVFNGFSKSADMAVEEEMPMAPADGALSYGTANGAADDSFTVAESAAAGAESSAEPAAYATTSRGQEEEAGVDFADTNTRVEGVGEAHVVKTDGKYIYVLSHNNIIGIFRAEKDGSVTLTGTIDCNYDNAAKAKPGYSNTNVSEFYVSGDRLIANATYWSYDDDWTTDKQLCGLMIYDISDRAAPELIREYWQDGWYVSSRVVGDSLILISNYSIDAYARVYTAENVIPGTYDAANGEKCLVKAGDIAVVNTAKPDSYVVVGKASLSDLSGSPEVTVLFGGGCEVYCTAETLYVYNTEYCWDTAVSETLWRSAPAADATTTVMAFDVTPAKPEFRKKGTVEGYLLNAFSLDEYDGYLRLALTRSDENAVCVLDGNLEPVGELTGIAPGEIIKSVRFMGDTAYVVTFVQTDPLFVIDLSDPTKPVIKGEVKLPGFSSYLHPVGNGLLLGIGSGGTEDGIDGSAKISLFDVSDPTDPKEVDNIVYPDAWLTSDYKAFVAVKGDGSYLIPLQLYAQYTEDDGFSSTMTMRARTGAVRVAVENGRLTEKNRYLVEESEYFWYGCERATYIGDTVYTVSGIPYLASFDMATGELLSQQSFSEEFEKLYREHSGVDEVDWESETAVVYNGDDVVMTSPAYDPNAPETAAAYTTPEPDTVPIDGDGADGAPDTVPETLPPVTEAASR